MHPKTDLPKVTNIFSKAAGPRIKKELNLKLENLVTLYIKKMVSLAKVTVKEKGNPRPLLCKRPATLVIQETRDPCYARRQYVRIYCIPVLTIDLLQLSKPID